MIKNMTNNINQKAKEVAAILRLIADNFRAFITEVIGLNNVQFHNELDDTLSSQLNRKIVIALPRGFGKSTHLAVGYPLWEMAKDHNIRVLIVSNTAEISRTSLSAIKGHVEKNRKYKLWAKAIDPKGRGILPQLRPRHKREEHWSADAITIEHDDLQTKDPTVSAVGLFGSILSRRVDIIICDDIINQQNSETEDQRNKIKDWVHTTLLPVLVPGGRLIYIGNTWHLDDLMSNMLKDPQFDVRKRIPAILHEATRQDLWEQWANIQLDESMLPEDRKNKAALFYDEHRAEMDIGVEVLWPERFPYADLYMKRIANAYSFARMFQCDPSIRPNQQFLEKDIDRALQKGKDLVLGNALPETLEIDYIVSGLDLAISQEASADDTVLLTLGHVKYGNSEIKDGDYIVLNIQRGKLRPKEVADMVTRHNAIMQPIGIRVETVAFQDMMAQNLEDRGIPVTSYKTGKEKHDPDIGVYSLSVLLSRGKLVFPYSNIDAHTRQTMMKLVNEMRAYPDGHTGDSLMALWFAVSEMRDYLQGGYTTPSGPYIPTPQGPATEQEADKELIAKQEFARGGYDPARELLARAQEAERKAREYIKSGQEEKDEFNKKMRRY